MGVLCVNYSSSSKTWYFGRLLRIDFDSIDVRKREDSQPTPCHSSWKTISEQWNLFVRTTNVIYVCLWDVHRTGVRLYRFPMYRAGTMKLEQSISWLIRNSSWRKSSAYSYYDTLQPKQPQHYRDWRINHFVYFQWSDVSPPSRFFSRFVHQSLFQLLLLWFVHWRMQKQFN